MNCLSCRAELDDFLDASLSPSQREKVAAHLRTCAECSAQLAQLETDRRLTRLALAELVAVSAPPELRLRVRAALQDERAANLARPAWWQKLRLPSKSSSAVWSGTLVFATLALLILARPFAQQPLSLPDSVSSAPSSPADSESKTEAANSQPDEAPQSPSIAAKKTAPATSGTTLNGVAKKGVAPAKIPSRAATIGQRKSGANQLESPTEPTHRARVDSPAPPLSLPLLPLSKPLPLPAPPAVPRPSKPAAALMKSAPAVSRVARTDATRIAAKTSNGTVATTETDGAPPPITIAPASRRDAHPARQSAVPSLNSGAAVSQTKPSQNAMGSNRNQAANLGFEAKISLAESFDGVASQNDGRQATASERAAPGGNLAAQAPAARQMPSPQTSRNTAQSAAGATADSQAFAPAAAPPQFGSPQTNSGAFGSGAGGRGGAGSARGAAPPTNFPALAAPRASIAAGETRQWTLEITAPREVSGAQIRVMLPPTLRFAAGDGAASRVVWSGDLAARRAVKIEFALSGARGGEKITVVVEQNGAAGESKRLETLEVALPTPN